MKTPPHGTPNSQRAMQTGKMRPSSAAMSNSKNQTSQRAKSAAPAITKHIKDMTSGDQPRQA